jgi:hypothetical protein
VDPGSDYSRSGIIRVKRLFYRAKAFSEGA